MTTARYRQTGWRKHRTQAIDQLDIVTQQHGGTIAVDSRVGEFTEFAIRLPRPGSGMTAVEAAG